MSDQAAHTRRWQIFEVVFGLPLLAALGLQLLFPLRLPLSLAVRLGIGAPLALAGLALISRARRELRAHGQPTDPGAPTRELVTGGVFSISRNPLYLGGVCFLAGIAAAAGLGWFWLLLAPALLACHFILIAPEESYLAARFGASYLAYAAAVHRWLGRKKR